jgi:alginate O-acetyltransferase complex protein AlgI
MLFNSFEFLVFFAVVYTAYLALSRWHRGQNLMLLAASLVFYGWWDWRFLGLMAFSITVDWAIAQGVAASDDAVRRKRLLLVSVVTQLTILGFFKYFGFFAESLVLALESIGLKVHAPTLKVVLPVGISFYTFQTMSYTIDVYRRAMAPVRSWTDFALFISFFPQLVAGPIERATHLLPQVLKPRKITWDGVHAGVFLVLVGLFKKTVIADNLGLVADEIFNNYTKFNGVDTLVGALAFTFQIYCDFSAYSDIARGVAKMMGFDLMVNFRLPYFSVSPSDFWRRWHISLSTWLRDYLYIALGGNRGGEWVTYRNLALTMLLGGLWHGAAWNFVLWGAFHGLILVVYRFAEQTRARAGKPPVHLWGLALPLRVLLMFALTVVGWILFRSHSVDQLWQMLTRIGPETSPRTLELVQTLLFYSLPLMLAQALEQWRRDLLVVTRLPAPLLGLLYGVMITLMLILGVRESMEFIYFQF